MEYKNENKICQNCKKDFTIEIEDFNFYEKIQVPPPTFCPFCRMIRRFTFRNERYLFRRLSALDSKEIFSGFPPEADIKTYENNYWFSDKWDPLKNGFEYDFDKNFFDQYRILLSLAPIPARAVYNLVNSDYCNETSEAKNCYLCFNSDYIENSSYLRKGNHIKDSIDLYECTESELCYECVNVNKSYQTFFSVDCEGCVDVWFSKNCIGCTSCFGCVNLINKSYMFFNETCSKESYIKKVKDYVTSSYDAVKNLKERSEKFWLLFPNKFYHGYRNKDSFGEMIFDNKNVQHSYSIRGCENLRYCQDLKNKVNDSYDYSVQVDGSENIYEYMIGGLGCYNCKFCFNCWVEVRDLEYCIFCVSSSNCFGCVGLHKKNYCIFNKQYSKEEYFELRNKIINQMNEIPYIDTLGNKYRYGEFFPSDISPTSYNESLAQDFFPLTKKEVEEKGYKWRDINFREYKKTINATDLPDHIDDVSEDFLKQVIECVSCKRAFKIITIEFQFYKKYNIPLPRDCHDCRFTKRFKFVNPPKFWHRKCMKEGCQNEFETSYALERPEIVYCEKCYQQEVY